MTFRTAGPISNPEIDVDCGTLQRFLSHPQLLKSTNEKNSFYSKEFQMKQFLNVLIILLTSLNLFAEDKATTTTWTIQANEIKIRAFSTYTCTKYEDDNSFDGQCLEEDVNCNFRVELPNKNILEKPVTFSIHDSSLFGMKFSSDKTCDETAIEWKNELANKSLNFYVTQEVKDEVVWLTQTIYGGYIRYKDSIYSRHCYYLQSLKGTIQIQNGDETQNEHEDETGNENRLYFMDSGLLDDWFIHFDSNLINAALLNNEACKP